MPSEASLGSSETGLAVAAAAGEKSSSSSSASASSSSSAGAGGRTRLWQDGVFTQLVRAAVRLEGDARRFRDEFYNPKNYANLLGSTTSGPGSGTGAGGPPELQLWLHLDGLAAHSATFRQMLTGSSLLLANGELLPTGTAPCCPAHPSF